MVALAEVPVTEVCELILLEFDHGLATLQRLSTQGDYTKTSDVFDMLLDIRSSVAKIGGIETKS